MSSKQSDLPFVAALGFIQGAWTWKRKKTLVPEGPLGRAEFSPKRTLQDVVVTAEVFLVFFLFFFIKTTAHSPKEENCTSTKN